MRRHYSVVLHASSSITVIEPLFQNELLLLKEEYNKSILTAEHHCY
jgi:hypothetical protein